MVAPQRFANLSKSPTVRSVMPTRSATSLDGNSDSAARRIRVCA